MTEHNTTPPIMINVVNTATATATAGGTALNHPSLFMRVLWFVLIGWAAGMVWAGAMAVFAITILGFPFAVAMAKYLTTALWLGKVNW